MDTKLEGEEVVQSIRTDLQVYLAQKQEFINNIQMQISSLQNQMVEAINDLNNLIEK